MSTGFEDLRGYGKQKPNLDYNAIGATGFEDLARKDNSIWGQVKAQANTTIGNM